MTAQELAIQTDSPLTDASAGEIMLNPELLKGISELANIMASSKVTIPAHLKGSQGDCYAIVLQAVQWKMNPFAVAQKTHLVNGVLGYEAQLVNAVINSMSPTEDRLHYEWYEEDGANWDNVLGKFSKKKNDQGKWFTSKDWKPEDEIGLGIKVWATLKGEDEPRELDLKLVQAEVRNSPLWASDPRQQLAYLAVKRWARLYTPDVLLGVYTPDELQETPQTEKEIGPATSDLNAALKGDLVTEGDEVVDVVDEPEPEPEEEKEPMTFAMVAEAINTMPDMDARQGVAQMTAEFVGIDGNEKFHEELTEIFKKKVASLKAIADNDPSKQ